MTKRDGGVTLRLFGALRQAAGGYDIQLEAGAGTVREALAKFAASLVLRSERYFAEWQRGRR